MSETGPTAPFEVVVTGGNPTDDELAALLAVLQASRAVVAAGEGERDARPRAGGWRSHTRMMRRHVPPGRDAWRYSGIPGAM